VTSFVPGTIIADCDVSYKLALQCEVTLTVGILILLVCFTFCKNNSDDPIALCQMLLTCLSCIQLAISFIFIETKNSSSAVSKCIWSFFMYIKREHSVTYPRPF
jgi:hypothetical protein